jgi:hypothetical protein
MRSKSESRIFCLKTLENKSQLAFFVLYRLGGGFSPFVVELVVDTILNRMP